MQNNQDLNVTVEELVETLRRSHIQNIVVEGKEDIIFYRELETRLDAKIHQAGGREKLLRVYDILSDSEKKGDFRHSPVAFIADRDMWVFRGIPDQYKEIVWTDGYSIENDLYSIANLRARIKDPDYEDMLDSISSWFACKVEEYLEKNPPPPKKIFHSIRDEVPVKIDIHSDQIVPKKPRGNTKLADGIAHLSSEHQRVQKVRNQYNLQLRGKILFELLVRFLSQPNRGFTKASINAYALYNDAITVPESNKLFSRLQKDVIEKLNDQEQKLQCPSCMNQFPNNSIKITTEDYISHAKQ